MSITESVLLLTSLLLAGYIIYIKKTPGAQPGEALLTRWGGQLGAALETAVASAAHEINTVRQQAVASVAQAGVTAARVATAQVHAAAASTAASQPAQAAIPTLMEKAMSTSDLLTRQILQMYACVGPTNPEVRPAHDAEYQSFGSGGAHFVPQRMYTAYWATLFNDGQLMSDADLMALPAVPAWMVTPGLDIPPESQSSGAWNKHVRTFGGGNYNAGLVALIAAVKAGNAQP
jgi:hypothetical protein